MTLPKLPPEFRSFAEQTKARLTKLERRLESALGKIDDRDTWDLAGEVYESASGDLPLLVAKRAVLIQMTLVEPGDTETEVVFRRNGTTVTTLTFPPDATRVEAGVSVPFDIADLASVACTGAGTNAQSLVVVVHWR